MPLPKPNASHKTKDDWVSACMGMAMMKTEFPDEKQRLAVCHKQWSGRSADEELERRYLPVADLRVVSEDGHHRLRGYAIVFNSLSLNLGGFRERIRPEAIQRTLEEKIDLRALVDHDTAKVLGRVGSKTLRLRPDDHGLGVDIDPPNTSYGRDILESVGRGDVSGMSFAFRTVTDDWHMEDEMPIRDVLDMRISEVSVVTFPAYPATEIDVAKRSLERFQASQMYRPSLKMLENQLLQDRS